MVSVMCGLQKSWEGIHRSSRGGMLPETELMAIYCKPTYSCGSLTDWLGIQHAYYTSIGCLCGHIITIH